MVWPYEWSFQRHHSYDLSHRALYNHPHRPPILERTLQEVWELASLLVQHKHFVRQPSAEPEIYIRGVSMS
jgi:hypothetical protein